MHKRLNALLIGGVIASGLLGLTVRLVLAACGADGLSSMCSSGFALTGNPSALHIPAPDAPPVAPSALDISKPVLDEWLPSSQCQ